MVLQELVCDVRKELSIQDDRTESDNRIEVAQHIGIAETTCHTLQDEKARNRRMRNCTFPVCSTFHCMTVSTNRYHQHLM